MTRLRLFKRKRAVTVKPSRQVQTKYGTIEGARLVDEGDCQIDAFLGIPFAKPPVGTLRFKKPEPPESWEGIKKTVKFGPRPPQKDFIWDRWKAAVNKSEDCLYLNVFSPAWTPAEKQANGFAVMVFVHGGGFLMDSASKYGDINICNGLCRRNVVVVTIEYRLGFLGFFCTGDEVCPGNNGLWDQAMALQWVKENIASFNGDPERITVFGQSAGGASVDLLSLSPKSRGRESSEQMLAYLRTLPAKVFELSMFSRNGKLDTSRTLILAPVIDGDFLPKSIVELRKETPVKNCIVGACEHEGLLFTAFARNANTMRGIDKLLAANIPAEKYSNCEKLRAAVKKYYLDGVDVRNKKAIAKAYNELSSNLFITNGAAEYAEKMAYLGHKVYLYSFDHFNPKSFGILSLRFPFKGATHCTDVAYVFGVSITFPFKYTKIDEQVKNVTTDLWTNFAKFGDPNGESDAAIREEEAVNWLPVEKNKPPRYLSIGTLRYQMKEEFANRRNEFWRNLGKDPSDVVHSNMSN